MGEQSGITIEATRRGPVREGGMGVDLLEVKVKSGLPLEYHLDAIHELIHDGGQRKWVSPCGAIVVESTGLCPDALNVLIGYLASTGCFEEVLIPHGAAQYLVVGGRNTTKIGQTFAAIGCKPHLIREGVGS